jgi:hypothetical protein
MAEMRTETAGPGGAYDVKILDPVKNGLVPWKTVP